MIHIVLVVPVLNPVVLTFVVSLVGHGTRCRFPYPVVVLGIVLAFVLTVVLVVGTWCGSLP